MSSYKKDEIEAWKKFLLAFWQDGSAEAELEKNPKSYLAQYGMHILGTNTTIRKTPKGDILLYDDDKFQLLIPARPKSSAPEDILKLDLRLQEEAKVTLESVEHFDPGDRSSPRPCSIPGGCSHLG